MEVQNPAFESQDGISMSKMAEGSAASRDSLRPKHPYRKKMSGRTCAISTAALFAILVLALVGVTAIVVFRPTVPTVSESQTEASVSSDLQVAMIQEEMKNLKQLVDEIATKYSANISAANEEYNSGLQELQQQHIGTNTRNNEKFRELQNQQNESKLVIQELQNESKLTIHELLNQQNELKLTVQELVNQQNESQLTIQKLRSQQNESKFIIRELQNQHNDVAANHAANISALKEQQTDVIKDLEQQLNQSKILMQEMQQLQSEANVETNKLANQLNGSIQEIDKKYSEGLLHLQLQSNHSNRALQMNIDILTANVTQTTTNVEHLQSETNAKNELANQLNVSIQQIGTKCTEGILSLQMQTNHSNRALQMDIDTLNEQTTTNIEHIQSEADIKTNEIANQLNVSIQQMAQKCTEGLLYLQLQTNHSNRALQMNIDILTANFTQTTTNVEHLWSETNAKTEVVNQLNRSIQQIGTKCTEGIILIQQQTNNSNTALRMDIDILTANFTETITNVEHMWSEANELTNQINGSIQQIGAKCTQSILSLQLQTNHSNRALQMNIHILTANMTQTTTNVEHLRSETNAKTEVVNQLNVSIQQIGTKCTKGILSLQLQTNQSNRALQIDIGTLNEQTTTNIEHLQSEADIKTKEIANQLNESIQQMAQKCTEGLLYLQLQTNHSNRALQMNIDILTANFTQTTTNVEHLRSETNVKTELANQLNVSIQQIGTKCTEGILSLQMQTNHSNRALQMDIDILTANFTETTTNVEHLQSEANELANQLNVSIQQIGTKYTEGLLYLQLQANHSNRALQMHIDTLTNNVTQITTNIERKINQLKIYFINTTSGGVQMALGCAVLPSPTNGGVSVQIGPNSLTNGLGSVATYYCDPGYALVGEVNRTCEDINGGTVTMGTWTKKPPICQDIRCAELTAPDNGNVMINNADLLVDTVATYSCDQGYVLAGDTVRTCKERGDGTEGTWNATQPICEGAIPNQAMIDCEDTDCRYEQLVCPEQDNCTVNCYDSRQYACYKTDLFCPNTKGDCTLHCDDDYACLQTNTTCTQGDCTVNCQDDYTCLNSAFLCSGDNCHFNCDRRESCSNSKIECVDANCSVNCLQTSACTNLVTECSGDNCLIDCRGSSSCSRMTRVCSSDNCLIDCQYQSCQNSNIRCTRGNCTVNGRNDYSLQSSIISCPPDGLCVVNCTGYYACQYSQLTCPRGGNCVFNFHGENGEVYTGRSTTISCQDNSTCSIYCSGQSNSNYRQCYRSRITCPPESEDCSVECSGF